MTPEYQVSKPPTLPVVGRAPLAAIVLEKLANAPTVESPQQEEPSHGATNATPSSPPQTSNSSHHANVNKDDNNKGSTSKATHHKDSESSHVSSGHALARAAEQVAIDIAENRLHSPTTPKQVVLNEVQDEETSAQVRQKSEAVIQQKKRVLPKLTTLKKTFNIKNPDPVSLATMSTTMSTTTNDTYFPQQLEGGSGSSQLPSPASTSGRSSPIPGDVTNSGNFIDTLSGRMRSLDASSFRKRVMHGTRRRKDKDKDPASRLIQFNEPRLVDANTTPGDPRYFHSKNDPEPEGDFTYDFLYQHERGAFLLGTPKFSAKSLLPIDPDEWTDSQFRSCGLDITNYEVPDPSWEWVHRSWLVDMTGDVDEDGWEYAMTFHGSPWHGNHEIFRSFARRRRWLRLRKKKGKVNGRPGEPPAREYNNEIQPVVWTKADLSSNYLESPSPFPPIHVELPMESSGPDTSIGSPLQSTSNHTRLSKLGLPAKALRVDLFKILKKAHSDRQKLAHLAEYVVRYPGDFEDIETRLDAYLGLLDYESSRREMLVLLVTYGRKEMVLKAVKKLEFYSDQKRLLKHADSKAVARP